MGFQQNILYVAILALFLGKGSSVEVTLQILPDSTTEDTTDTQSDHLETTTTRVDIEEHLPKEKWSPEDLWMSKSWDDSKTVTPHSEYPNETKGRLETHNRRRHHWTRNRNHGNGRTQQQGSRRHQWTVPLSPQGEQSDKNKMPVVEDDIVLIKPDTLMVTEDEFTNLNQKEDGPTRPNFPPKNSDEVYSAVPDDTSYKQARYPDRVCPCCANVTKCDKKEGIGFYSIPKVVTGQGEDHEKLTEERRRLWISAISRADTETKNILQSERVCGRHFISGKAAPVWDRHNPDWVPTLNLGRTDYRGEAAKEKQQKEAGARAKRATGRKKKRGAEQHETPAAAKRAPQRCVRQIDFAQVEDVPLDVEMADLSLESKEPQDAETRTEELQYAFSSVSVHQESKIAGTQTEEFEYMFGAPGYQAPDRDFFKSADKQSSHMMAGHCPLLQQSSHMMAGHCPVLLQSPHVMAGHCLVMWE
ncbi:Hypp573 [Branchiostoma lanceolatum]|uniref:Hypp573 protein n=1 Tax=Branchiostoma lanceolatum TaxID=7740 RepID=A0A8J9YPA2_BRALA|nr:Hypp573 [Branchiostoma lanceolatum]